jgi:outer membrane lipoprotein-sorting protein
MIRLTPRHPREEFEAIELEAASADGQVLRVVVQDSLGNLTEFLFEEIEENLEIPDSLFLFTIPSGVDVVVDSGSSTRR